MSRSVCLLVAASLALWLDRLDEILLVMHTILYRHGQLEAILTLTALVTAQSHLAGMKLQVAKNLSKLSYILWKKHMNRLFLYSPTLTLMITQ